ncbi:MAG: hypothetical protein GX230_06410 [Lentisphaerae bacterium]|jgi:pyridoxine/pyridoxamine 5'-phosphate oxidase|nr:hypothetical protein [Lentisphaerota bacterium]
MGNWRKELGKIVTGKGSATRAELENAQFADFLKNTAAPALQQIAGELAQYNRETSIREAPASVAFTVRRDGIEEVSFRIMRRYITSGIVAYAEVRVAKGTHYTRHDVAFGESGATVDLLTEDDIINSFLKVYRMINEGE